jgi:hypothetical protein
MLTGVLMTLLCRLSVVVCLLGSTAIAQEGSLPDFPSYETKYYIIHTDLPPEATMEAAVRMTRMAEEYHARTRAFSGDIRRKFDFYLFSNPEDYYQASGAPGTAGVFNLNRNSLMAIVGDEIGGDTWHTVQHEGFHQFAHAVIGGQLPIWVNEGLAEYFGEGLYTGDGFITGVIPPWRLERIKETFKDYTEEEFIPIPDMMDMSHYKWNDRMSITNYDQAWSMIHFLAHGEDGAYQKALNDFMVRIGKGQQWQKAWRDTFGDAAKFEARWKKWWTELPDAPTADLYRQATVATLTSFLARATSQQQKFDSFDTFLKTAEAGDLKFHKDDWLPPVLLRDAILDARAGGEWSIESPPGKPPLLVRVGESGEKDVGHFTISGGRVKKVWVEGK